MRFVTATAALLIVLVSPIAARPARADDAPPKLDDLLGTAKKDGRPIALEFYADWCKPCRWVERNLLPAAEVKQALAAFHFARYDAEAAPGSDAARALEVVALPTFVVIGADGDLIARFEGAPKSAALLRRWLDEQAPRALGLDRLLARAAQRPDDAALQLLAGTRMARAGRYVEAGRFLVAAETADKGNKAGLASRATWLRGLMSARQATHAARRAFLEEWLRRYPKDAHAVAALEALAVIPDLPEATRKQVFGGAVDAARRDAARLNDLVYICLRAGALDEAQRAAEALATLAPRDGNSWDTLAEVYHYRGDRRMALEHSSRALALAPEGDERRQMAANRERYERGQGEPAPDVVKIVGPKWEDDAATEAAEEAAAAPAEAGGGGLTPALRETFERVAEACREPAGAAPEAWVRVVLGSGTRALRVIVLEPGLPSAAVKCLETALGGEGFPPAAPDYPSLTAPVRFKKPGAAPPWMRMRR